jgi:DNA-directed RNA polymerase omega subunit
MEDTEVQAAPEHQPKVPDTPAAPITSRFLFVDVAAMRAKQLRRGALQRFSDSDGRHEPHKPERVAMEEVRRGLVQYQVPELPGVGREGA